MSAEEARSRLEHALEEAGVDWSRGPRRIYTVALPGENRLSTTVQLRIGSHSVALEAFVARRPDESHEQVYRWLLRSNAKHPMAAFAVDDMGDIYIVGRLPVSAVSDDVVDRWLGLVLTTVDSAFNTILAMGFATSIRKEWAWRLARGESTFNLSAFESLRPENLTEEPAPSSAVDADDSA